MPAAVGALQKECFMSATAAVQLTPEGWRKLHDDLVELRERLEAARAAQAQVGGSTKEAGEAASQSEIEYLSHTVTELEWVLARAKPVEDGDREPGVVGVGAEVQVRWEDGDAERFMIVGPPEVAPREGRISYESPVGQALMGRRAGEQVWVATMAGRSRLDVIEVR
jgi:transcription elongation factor GreA